MKKKFFSLIIFMLISLNLSACTKTGGKVDAVPGSPGYKIYCLTNEETELVSENYFSSETDPRRLITELLGQLETTPADIACKRAKPEQVYVEKFILASDGKLTLYFNSEYSQITGLSEVLMRAAIVKTLCQIPEVDSIEFYVSGQPLMQSGDTAVGFMKGEDFIDNTGDETNFYQYADLALYFPTADGKSLTVVPVSIKYDGTIALEELIIQQLIAGPDKISGVDKDAVLSGVPADTKINKVSVVDGICYVDLSKEFLSPVENVMPQVSIYSIVNSLAELSHIDKVEMVIDGESVETYLDTVQLNQTFERNLDLME